MFGVRVSLPWKPTSAQPRSSARKMTTFGWSGAARATLSRGNARNSRRFIRITRISVWQRNCLVACMIRKLKSGEYRLYSRKKDPKSGKRRNLGTFNTREAAEKHEREVQYFKRH